MNSSIDSAIRDVAPTLREPFPESLRSAVDRLYASSRQRISLKQNEEAARFHICAVVAIKKDLTGLNTITPLLSNIPLALKEARELIELFTRQLNINTTPAASPAKRKLSQSSEPKNRPSLKKIDTHTTTEAPGLAATTPSEASIVQGQHDALLPEAAHLSGQAPPTLPAASKEANGPIESDETTIITKTIVTTETTETAEPTATTAPTAPTAPAVPVESAQTTESIVEPGPFTTPNATPSPKRKVGRPLGSKTKTPFLKRLEAAGSSPLKPLTDGNSAKAATTSDDSQSDSDEYSDPDMEDLDSPEKKFLLLTSRDITAICNKFELDVETTNWVVDTFQLYFNSISNEWTLICGLILNCYFVVNHHLITTEVGAKAKAMKAMTDLQTGGLSLADIQASTPVIRTLIEHNRYFKKLKIKHKLPMESSQFAPMKDSMLVPRWRFHSAEAVRSFDEWFEEAEKACAILEAQELAREAALKAKKAVESKK